MNKLDAFNKDKDKCVKCKEYFDSDYWNVCKDCRKKWEVYYEPLKINHVDFFNEIMYELACFKKFLKNDEQ
jgi:hypothetical protein